MYGSVSDSTATSSMSDSYFLDTNVIVYAFDSSAPSKQSIARESIRRALETRKGHISTQVVQEFLNVALRRFAVPLRPVDATTYLEQVLRPLCTVFPDLALYREALGLHERWQYSFYDALILAGALRCGARRLYSEDLQHGQRIGDLEIVNPFVGC